MEIGSDFFPVVLPSDKFIFDFILRKDIVGNIENILNASIYFSFEKQKKATVG
jgi:hypothetical protein